MYKDFCPRVQKMLNLVEEDAGKGADDKGGVCEWKLRVHGKLERWVVGGVALVGDACHPTLPHLAQVSSSWVLQCDREAYHAWTGRGASC